MSNLDQSGYLPGDKGFIEEILYVFDIINVSIVSPHILCALHC